MVLQLWFSMVKHGLTMVKHGYTHIILQGDGQKQSDNYRASRPYRWKTYILNKRPKGSLIAHLSTIRFLSESESITFVKSVRKANRRPKGLISITAYEYHQQSCHVFLYMKITQNESRLNTLLHRIWKKISWKWRSHIRCQEHVKNVTSEWNWKKSQ